MGCIKDYTSYAGECVAPMLSPFDMTVFLDWCSNMEHVVVFSAWSIHYNLIYIQLFDCTSSRVYVFKSCSAMPRIEIQEGIHHGSYVKTVAGVWSSPSHGLSRPDVISYVSLLDRAEAVPLISFVVPWKRELWRVVQDKVGIMSANQFVSALAYCRDNMEVHEYMRLKNHMDKMRMDSNLVRRKEKIDAFVYQRLLSCLWERDAPSFVELLQ